MHSDQTRLRRLNEILERLSSGQSVQNRALQAWLKKKEYLQYQSQLVEQSDLRSTLKNKPLEVVQYERLLKRAFLLYSRSKRYTGKTGYEAKTIALTACERAIEYLREAVGGRGDLELWFDRPVTCSPGGELGADPHTMPIPITSKSRNKRPNTGYSAMLLSQRDLKIAAVETAISNLQHQQEGIKDDEDALIEVMRKRKKPLDRSII